MAMSERSQSGTSGEFNNTRHDLTTSLLLGKDLHRSVHPRQEKELSAKGTRTRTGAKERGYSG